MTMPYPQQPRRRGTSRKERVEDWIRTHKIKTSLGVVGISFATLMVYAAANPVPAPGDAGYVPPGSTTTRAAIQAVDDETSTTTTTTRRVRPVTYKGTGDRVLKLRKPEGGPVIVQAVYRGGSNFQVEAHGGGDMQLLVNTIGAYRGTTLLDPEDSQESSSLKVTASGPWNLVLRAITDAPELHGTVRGHGDAVLLYRGDGGTATMRHRGQSNFQVQTYSSEGLGLLANEIGTYSGQDLMPEGPAVVVVTADGRWSITVD